MAGKVKNELKQAKRHLNAGFNGMLPLIIVGAIGLALGNLLPSEGVLGELFAFLNEVGLDKFDIFMAIVIGQSMAGKTGMATGFILGYYSNQLGMGVFGGIVVGFIAGYAGVLFNKLKLEGSTKALLSLVVVPLVTAVIGFFLIRYCISGPVLWIQSALIGFLNNISSTSAVLLAVVLGLMFGFDLGGPINKTGGIFVMISLTEGIRGPITYATAAYMLPSMAAGLATMLDRKKILFDEDEHVQGPSIFVLGLLSLSEPALPLMFDEAVLRRGMSPVQFARLSATNGAKRFSLYPRKGSIHIGADADLILIDPSVTWEIDRKRSFSKTKNTRFPYQGRIVNCGVAATLVRGKVVYDHGKIVVQPGYGKFQRPW